MITRRQLLTAVVFVLPVCLCAHAMTFWGRGIIDKEALTFVVNYLAGRPFLSTIFDPRLNDWGLYQARELSYVFDFADARVFATLLDRHVLLFVPLSGVVGLLAVAGVYVGGARKVLRLDGITTALLLSVFLSCIVTQASTAILYRSSKIVLSVALLAFLFLLTSIVTQAVRASWQRLAGLFVLGLVMSLSDRQGFYYLVAATATIAALSLVSRLHRGETRNDAVNNAFGVVAIGLATIAVSVSYNDVLAPRIIHWANGYWPSFEYQHLPWSDAQTWTIARQAWVMLRAQTSYFFGNAPFALVSLIVVVCGAASIWRTRLAAPTIIVTAAVLGSLFVLLALMILRHPPVFAIPDHSFWYYTLTVHVICLFVLSLVLSTVRESLGSWSRFAVALVLVLMVVNNIRHYPEQREVMINSAKWFKNQYEHSQRFVNDFDAMEGGSPQGARSPASWLRVGQAGATVELPADEQGFLDGVQAAYATLERRHPLADASGPYWSAVRAFLESKASPLNDPTQMPAVIEAFQSIGVRRVVLDASRYRDPERFRATGDTLLASSPLIRQVRADATGITADLTDDALEPPARATATRIPAQALHITTSHASDRIPFLVDGDVDTRWISGSHQSGDEWIRVGFDKPRDVVRVELVMTERSLGDYPRALVIASEDGGQVRTLYRGSPLGALLKGLLREPDRAPIDIALPANHTTTLIVRQTGQTQVWFWSVHELRLWER